MPQFPIFDFQPRTPKILCHMFSLRNTILDSTISDLATFLISQFFYFQIKKFRTQYYRLLTLAYAKSFPYSFRISDFRVSISNFKFRKILVSDFRHLAFVHINKCACIDFRHWTLSTNPSPKILCRMFSLRNTIWSNFRFRKIRFVTFFILQFFYFQIKKCRRQYF